MTCRCSRCVNGYPPGGLHLAKPEFRDFIDSVFVEVSAGDWSPCAWCNGEGSTTFEGVDDRCEACQGEGGHYVAPGEVCHCDACDPPL